ncbi:hypothetical protein MTO96_027020 [Rhipicephalus appendiculatus]
MLKAYERSSLMSASIPVGTIPEEKLASGLVAGHAYSITAVRLVYIERLKGRMPLIRLRNPWGDDTEWRGGLERPVAKICNLGPDSLDQDVLTDTSKKKWEVSVFEGSWVRGATAGGCRNYLDTFWVNPQYFITLEDPDDDDEEQNCTCDSGTYAEEQTGSPNSGGQDCS